MVRQVLQMCLANSSESESNIGRETGIHRATLSRFRRGVCEMSLDNTERLLDYFQVKMHVPEHLQQAPVYRSKYTKTERWYAEQQRRRSERKQRWLRQANYCTP